MLEAVPRCLSELYRVYLVFRFCLFKHPVLHLHFPNSTVDFDRDRDGKEINAECPDMWRSCGNKHEFIPSTTWGLTWYPWEGLRRYRDHDRPLRAGPWVQHLERYIYNYIFSLTDIDQVGTGLFIPLYGKARPQWGHDIETIRQENVDVYWHVLPCICNVQYDIWYM